MMFSWTVVEFLPTPTENKSSVEAVPTKWYQEKKCYWPPMTRLSILNEIKKCATPSEIWPMYDIRIFKDGKYGNKK